MRLTVFKIRTDTEQYRRISCFFELDAQMHAIIPPPMPVSITCTRTNRMQKLNMIVLQHSKYDVKWSINYPTSDCNINDELNNWNRYEKENSGYDLHRAEYDKDDAERHIQANVGSVVMAVVRVVPAHFPNVNKVWGPHWFIMSSPGLCVLSTFSPLFWSFYCSLKQMKKKTC